MAPAKQRRWSRAVTERSHALTFYENRAGSKLSPPMFLSIDAIASAVGG